MRLFFKHLARSVIKKPLQPIILVVTLTLAIIVSMFSLSISDALEEETKLGQVAKYGNSQITIGLNSKESSRFMFVEDVEDVLKEDGVAVGTFELPLTIGQEKSTVYGVAVDLFEVGKIFTFDFVDYGQVTPSTLGNSAFITSKFANDNNLSVGDKFSVYAFGGEKTYRVSGINKYPFLNGYEVMVDITGVIRLITSSSPFLSAIGDDFKPSSTIYVHINDNVSVENFIEKLRDDQRFSQKTITDVSKAVITKTNSANYKYIIDITALLAVLLAASVTFCCFYIISSERTEENCAFKLSGAKPWMLNLVQYAEICAYWLISAVIGCAVSVPITKLLYSIAGFRYASDAIRPLKMFMGAGLLLLVCVATITAFICAQKSKNKSNVKEKREKIPVLVSLLFTLGLSVFVFVAPLNIRFAFYVILSVVLCFFFFISTSLVIKWFASKLSKRLDVKLDKTNRLKFVSFRYAVKNIFSVKILHNISRLVAMLTCIVMTSSIMIASSVGNSKSMQSFFNGEYVLFNATESCVQKVLECDSVHSTSKIFLSENDDGLIISIDNTSAISNNIKIEKLPRGNEAILSSGEAKKRSLSVGETFKQSIDGREIEFVVMDIVKSANKFLMLFDCEYFGISYNMILVKGEEGVSNGALLEELTDKTALELATIVSMESLFESRLTTAFICLKIGSIFFCMIFAFALVGMFDNLYESYRSRRDEFGLYTYSGMSRKTIRRMKAWEIALTFGVGLALGCVGFVLMLFTSNASFYTFGYELLLNLKNFFH